MAQQSGSALKRSKYRLLGLIGQGQFGQVFCAIHRPTGRLVALKNLEQDRFPTHKFLRELRFLLSLKHPNIVTFQALEHTSTGRYLVMDYCEGGSLRSLLTDEIRPSLPQSLQIVSHVLAGLGQAHYSGIVHCDIKPENILLHVHSGGWTARISDFGIARLSQEIGHQGGNSGSPAYMAPERFYGQYSIRSDLYSVGILLFELIAGYRPFSGTPEALRSAHLNTPVQLPDAIPSIWHPLLLRALQKLPARRFQSAEEMLAEIQSITQRYITEHYTSTKPFTTEQDAILRGSFEGKTNLLRLSNPLFWAVTENLECPFQPQYQSDSPQPLTLLAAILQEKSRTDAASDLAEVSPQPASTDFAAPVLQVYQVTGQQLWQQAFERETLTPIQPDHPPLPAAQASAPITGLVWRAQGCFIVTPHSVEQLMVNPLTAAPALEPVATWSEDRLVAIEPQGTWCVTLTLAVSSGAVSSETPSEASLPAEPSLGRQLNFFRLSGQSRFQLPDQPLRLKTIRTTDRVVGLFALDSRYVAVVVTDAASPLQNSPTKSPLEELAKEELPTTQIQILSRRGDAMGTFSLALRLQQVILTLQPYQLLATDAEQADTVLLIDLKPYRIRRFWVSITPIFLAVMPWGYILAEAEGKIVALDQTGQIIGTLRSPAPITALVTVEQHGLLLTTKNGESRSFYSLDLRTVGLDLVF